MSCPSSAAYCTSSMGFAGVARGSAEHRLRATLSEILGARGSESVEDAARRVMRRMYELEAVIRDRDRDAPISVTPKFADAPTCKVCGRDAGVYGGWCSQCMSDQ